MRKRGAFQADSTGRKAPKKRFNQNKKAQPESDYVDEIDEFMEQKNKIDFSSEEESDEHHRTLQNEVLGMESYDSDEGEENSQEGSDDDFSFGEEKRKPRNLEEEALKANWGKNKRNYYTTDYVDDEIISSDDGADEEEEVAKGIQFKQAQQLTEDDYTDTLGSILKKKIQKSGTVLTTSDHDLLANFKAQSTSDFQIEKDVSGLTKSQKLDILINDSPELIKLLDSFKTMINELRQTTLPILDWVEETAAPQTNGVQYLAVRSQLLLNYCLNICFYLLLKTKGRSIKDHPIMDHLLNLNNLFNKLKPVDSQLSEQIELLKDVILNSENEEEEGGSDETNGSIPGGSGSDDEYTDGDSEDGDEAGDEADDGIDGGTDEDDSDLEEEEHLTMEQLTAKIEQFKANFAAKKQNEKKNEKKPEKKNEKKPEKKTKHIVFEEEDQGDLEEDGGDDIFGTDSFVSYGSKDTKKGSKKRSFDSMLDAVDKKSVTESPAKKRKIENKKPAKPDSDDSEEDSFDDEEDEELAHKLLSIPEDDYYLEIQKSLQGKQNVKRSGATNEEEGEQGVELGSDGKRKINKLMEKNRGLRKKRAKIVKTGRAKNRAKMEKAITRRGGQVQRMRDATKKYDGEKTGIKTHTVRSTSLK